MVASDRGVQWGRQWASLLRRRESDSGPREEMKKARGAVLEERRGLPRGSASPRFFRTAQIGNSVNGNLTLARD